MAEKPMMQCGHAANAVDGRGKPCCAICIGIHPGADKIAETPDLVGRTARCCYYDTRTHRNEGPCGAVCDCEKPSRTSLPFFEYRPGQEFDSFYCGCRSWD